MGYLSLKTLRKRIAGLGVREIGRRLDLSRRLSAARGLRYLDDDSHPVTIDLALFPWILTRQQLSFFKDVACTVRGAMLRLPALYRENAEIRRILPFDESQKEWMGLVLKAPLSSAPLIGRLDSNAIFDSARWNRDFSMIEPNAVGVGGVHYAPAGCSVLLDVLGDILQGLVRGKRIVPTPDPRKLLVDEVQRLARKQGRKLRRLALLENSDYTTGTDEFIPLAEHLNEQGIHTDVVDPREISIKKGGILAKGKPVDFVYRDCELSEFVEIEQKGFKLQALRQLIRQGRLVSGLIWEFDLKSTWEVFTDARWHRFFSVQERRFFRKHLPWTRLVREDKVSDPGGKIVDLIKYARRNKEGLVLKPNALYGGQGVFVGSVTSQKTWDRELYNSIDSDTECVVQRIAPIHKERFWHKDENSLSEVERCVVSGFFCNSKDIGLVGRFSSDPVVNVSRGGGLLCALMIE